MATKHSDKDFVRDTVVMLLAGGQGKRLYPLTRHRAKPAVPYGGIYRIIDFTLSNCLNSGLRKIAVLTQYKSHSLNRHIRLAWNVFSTELGEFIDTVPPQQRITREWYEGTAHAIYQNIYTLEQERPRYVLVLAGDHVYKMNYRRMLEDHNERGADLTIACIEASLDDATRFGVMKADSDMRIVNFQEKPASPEPMPGKPDRALCSMGIYVFTTDVLVRRIIADAKDQTSHDFGKNVIPRMIDTGRVFAHRFEGVLAEGETPADTPYWRDIGTLDAYWEANMDLVSVTPALNLYDPDWPIRCELRQSPPAKIIFGGTSERGFEADVTDSCISPGCIISGARVERCILSPRVIVERNTYISDSIIMSGVRIGRNCRIHKAIMDKRTVVPDGTQIGLDREQDARAFTISDEGIVVVPKEMPMQPHRPV